MENTLLKQYKCPLIPLFKKKKHHEILYTWDFDSLIKDAETNRPKE